MKRLLVKLNLLRMENASCFFVNQSKVELDRCNSSKHYSQTSRKFVKTAGQMDSMTLQSSQTGFLLVLSEPKHHYKKKPVNFPIVFKAHLWKLSTRAAVPQCVDSVGKAMLPFRHLLKVVVSFVKYDLLYRWALFCITFDLWANYSADRDEEERCFLITTFNCKRKLSNSLICVWARNDSVQGWAKLQSRWSRCRHHEIKTGWGHQRYYSALPPSVYR